MTLSIIIPAYNEITAIDAVLEKVLSVALPDGMAREVIIVDDGSTDGTAQVLVAWAGHSQIKIIHQSNQGKAGAIVTGLKQAGGDILIIQDADLEYDPAEYPNLLRPILAGETQVVYGSRFLGDIRDMSWVNRLANDISNTAFRWLYGTMITDINTCYKVFTRRALEGITIEARNFAFETEITVKFIRKGLAIKEVPIHYAARTRAQGKKIRWGTALQMFWPILKYRFFDRLKVFTMRQTAIAFLFLISAAPCLLAEGYYFEYDTFRALTALAQEAPDPRPASLPEGGFELWAKGQMRLPAGGIFVEGDFNSDGLPDAALVFRSKNHRYLLIASRMQDRWTRQALLELQEQSEVTLDGDVLVLSAPKTFVAWDGHQYRMASESLPTVSSMPDRSKTKTPVNRAARPPISSETTTVRVPFRFFTGLSMTDLPSVNIRLSYLGPRDESLGDLAFVSEEMGREAQREFLLQTIPVPTVLLKQLLEALREPLESSDPQAIPKPFPWLSLTVEARGLDRAKSFQVNFNDHDAKGIFSIFRRTLEGHRLARYHLQSWGCAIDVLPAGRATDVTDRVGIKTTGSSAPPWEKVSKFLQQGRAAPSDVKISVTNRSPAALDGPVSVVFNLSGNAHVLEPDGRTCHTTVGLEFVDLRLRNNRLLPGETVEMPVSIENPEKEPVTFDLKVLAGPDPR